MVQHTNRVSRGHRRRAAGRRSFADFRSCRHGWRGSGKKSGSRRLVRAWRLSKSYFMSSRLRRDRSMWGIDELIQITAAKRAQPRLADRRIQIPWRRMPRFVPPTRKPRRSACNVRVAKDERRQVQREQYRVKRPAGMGRLQRGTRGRIWRGGSS
jgi:hypothetical protein